MAASRRLIESALPLITEFTQRRQWADAESLLAAPQAQLVDSNSPELEARIATASQNLEIAIELQRISQSFIQPSEAGYTIVPSRDAYASVLRRAGIGSDVDVETAVRRVEASPLRDHLLIALDYAAISQTSSPDDSELVRLMAVARTAAPDPWQDRLRDPTAWGDIVKLHQLINDAPHAQPPPPSHQMVMLAFLLLPMHDQGTIKILREAYLRDPSDFMVNIVLADTLRRDGQIAESLQFFRSAIALNPEYHVTWSELGATMVQNGMPYEAIPPLRRSIELQPEYPESWHALIHAYAANWLWDDALATERDALSAIPEISIPPETAGVLHLCRARSAAVQRDWQTAADAYASCVGTLNKASSEMLFEFAAARVLAGDIQGYRELCGFMTEQHEKLKIRRFLVARACTLVRGSDQEVVRASEVAAPELDHHVYDYWSLTQRGALLCRQKRHREAIRVLESSLRISSRPVDCIITWAWLSRAHLSVGEEQAARMWLGKVTNWLDQSTTKPEEIHLHNWLEALVLRRELEVTIDQ